MRKLLVLISRAQIHNLFLCHPSVELVRSGIKERMFLLSVINPLLLGIGKAERVMR
jgi:hypothetical protein